MGEALAVVPWGATITYGVLAVQLHKPQAARTMGEAVGRNRGVSWCFATVCWAPMAP